MSRPPIRAAEYVKRRTVSRLGRRVAGSATVRLRAIAFISVEQRTPGNLDPAEWEILRRVTDLIKQNAD